MNSCGAIIFCEHLCMDVTKSHDTLQMVVGFPSQNNSALPE
ncbi:MAG: hypothetical protein ACW9XH_06560 [Candidatus Nitrosopumilus sp. bin_32a]